MSARTFESLRGSTRDPAPNEKIVRAAAGKVFRTPEGQVLLAWLRNRVNRVLPADAADGALRDLNGAKRLAAEIEALVLLRD